MDKTGVGTDVEGKVGHKGTVRQEGDKENRIRDNSQGR
jgi:hypothetical protein